MKLIEKSMMYQRWFLLAVAIFALYGCTTSPQKPVVSESVEEPAPELIQDLLGEWCREKKRKITKYTVKEGQLQIRSGRSGRYYEANLTCNETLTVCEAMTVRGWGTPVTEILRLEGTTMNLTRVWGGAWKDKTYNFTYIRCPKW